MALPGVQRKRAFRIGALAEAHQRTDTRVTRESSKTSMIGERVTPSIADDDVIEYEDVHEG